jgi:nucleoside-diphosphate-sugar epimerase
MRRADMNGRVLVTGAAGFVGQAVSRRLKIAGLNVLTHSRHPSDGVDWAADLADESQLCRGFPADIQTVIHCAAAIPARSKEFGRDNAAATSLLAAALGEVSSLRRVVHVSSVAVYKRPPLGEWVLNEGAETVDFGDPDADFYARTKRSAELTLDSLVHRHSRLSIVHLRASSIYGPGMVPTTLLPAFVACAIRNEPLRLRGPRNYAQNFVHVDDVSDMICALTLSTVTPSSVVNAFSDDTYQLSALAELVRVGLKSSSDVVDDTECVERAVPIFVNARAKELLPNFRRLADHLRDAR